MAAQPEPEIILYDLACIKDVCFSPAVWRIRLMLNYKQIPYRTIFLEFPDIEPTLRGLGLPPHATSPAYTVPAIRHVASATHTMDSPAIARFLEATYPTRPVPLASAGRAAVEAAARRAVAPTARASVLPREVDVLRPRAAAHFRRTREAALGCALEALREPAAEAAAWAAADAGVRAAGEMMRAPGPEGEGEGEGGPFVLGAAAPSYTDFFVAGFLQAVRVVDEGVWERYVAYPGYGDIYRACLPYMEKKD